MAAGTPRMVTAIRISARLTSKERPRAPPNRLSLAVQALRTVGRSPR